MEPGATDAHAAQARANRLGILAMVGSMGCFVVNDALVKHVSETLPAAQLIFVRGIMATLLVLIVAHAMGATRRIREIRQGWVVGRAVIDAIATVLYLVSLFHLPITNATAINMTSPFLITLAAAAVIGERVGAPRWVATCTGFLGVLLIVQPQAEGFNAYALVCLLAAALMSVRDLVTRRVHAGVHAILVTISNTIAVMLLAGGLSLLEGWQPLSASQAGLLAVAAAFLATAYYLLVIGTRHGDLSLIAPFRYSALLFATLAGYLVWGDVPNALAWSGIALLIGSGVALVRASRRARVAQVAPD